MGKDYDMGSIDPQREEYDAIWNRAKSLSEIEKEGTPQALFENQNKIIKDQGKRQIELLEKILEKLDGINKC